MPSFDHELPLALLEQRQDLLVALLAQLPNHPLPRFATVTSHKNDLSQLFPVEFRADLVQILYAAPRWRRHSPAPPDSVVPRARRPGRRAGTRSESDPKPVLGLVFEVQTHRDNRKRYTLPVYGTVLRARIEAPVWVIVLAKTEHVAEWARRPIPLGPTDTPYPLIVIGPDQIPRVTGVQAKAMPELAVLASSVHGSGPDGDAVLSATLAAIAELDENRRALYWDMVYYSLNAAAKRRWEALMQAGTYQFKSKFARTYIAQGRAEGKAEGRAEGKAEGEAKGRAEAIVAVLKARRVPLKRHEREQILACYDLATLELWLTRAATAHAVEDVFAPAAPSPPSR